ncbi:YitT family protein [Metabacillus herbersteinensis]|uniref:YitT family protein n=1 Tax=Metabacillus herbersteinensis TaxID=283816 RepID=A0ABV6G9B6_9BACI
MKHKQRKSAAELFFRWSVYFLGLLTMSLGIVLTIRAELGVSPWDVLHIGLYNQFGLTIGSWAIIVGGVILTLSGLLTKKWPQLGAFVNMLTVGVFIDLYLLLPFLKTPTSIVGQLFMLLIGMMVMGYGIGIYISARCGAGPRDSLMMALVETSKKPISVIRGSIEVFVLLVGWLLGGPVFFGTILLTLTVGYIVGKTIPQCQETTDQLLIKLLNRQKENVHQVAR